MASKFNAAEAWGAAGDAGVSINSREIEAGQLFVAIRGARFDGHDFLEQAFARGACGAVVDRNSKPGTRYVPGPDVSPRDPVPVWVADDTVTALGDLARFHRDRFKPDLAAVTGSSGKSTTKTMLAHLLAAGRETLSTHGTQNNLIGAPLTLFRLNAAHRAAVLEIGANRWGEIGRLTEITRPTMGIVTNIGPAHLETFGDLRGVLREKGELWDRMEKGAPVILNADDPLLWEAGLALKRPVVWFGSRPEADVRAGEITWGPEGSRCVVNGNWEMRAPLAGRHNLMNALAALAAAWVLGEPLEKTAALMASAPALPGRLSISERDGLRVIDDTYNANPSSLRAALEVLAGLECPGRRILAIGDMLELGEQAESLHAGAGRWAVESRVDFLVSVGPLARRLLAAAWEHGLPREQGRAFGSPEEAGEFLSGFVKPGDALLLKGSRGTRMEKVLGCFTTSSTR